MPKAWGENPKVFELVRRSFSPHYSSRDPLGNEADPTNAGDLQFSTTAKAVDEDAGSISLTVSRVNGSDGEVTVDYATTDGTATAGDDYTSTSGTLTFADGETSKSISIPILDNADTDGDSAFDVNLSNAGGGASLGSPTTVVVTVRDDESELVTGENLLTRIKVENNSGSSSPQDQVYTFGSPIEPGQVSGGRTVELRHNSVTIPYQMDGECHQHHDGTLNFAVFTCRLPAIADGTSEFIDLVALDGNKPTGSVNETPLTNADYNLQLVVGGTTYTASLNDALSADQYDVERDGPVAKRYRAHIFFNDGSTDHSQLWARFYATVFVDGTTQVMAQVINGYIEAASNLEYSDLVLRSGTTTVRSTVGGWQGL